MPQKKEGVGRCQNDAEVSATLEGSANPRHDRAGSQRERRLDCMATAQDSRFVRLALMKGVVHKTMCLPATLSSDPSSAFLLVYGRSPSTIRTRCGFRGKSPLRTEMISSLDSDIVSPPGPVPLAIGSLALSRLSSIVLLI